ncbi:phosphopantetheine-binding protein [Streptomyces sp. NPDC047985]|uniref:phosphopantetheine-binding protein n=1 Tax=unclassified Streptomyces TaxID=2593676 RepID=UPI003440B768
MLQKQPAPAADDLEPRTAEQDPSGTEPRNEREAALCGVFAELLGIDQVGIHESFLALGGHSLLATRRMSRIRTVFGVEPDMGKVFEAPSVAEPCAHIYTAPAARSSLAGRARSRS